MPAPLNSGLHTNSFLEAAEISEPARRLLIVFRALEITLLVISAAREGRIICRIRFSQVTDASGVLLVFFPFIIGTEVSV